MSQAKYPLQIKATRTAVLSVFLLFISHTNLSVAQAYPSPSPVIQKVPIECKRANTDQVPNKPKWVDTGMKVHFVQLANRWCGGAGENLANECYNYVVTKSIEAGINPAVSLAVWLNETGAGNYTCVGPKARDFGINEPTITSNLSAQLKRFLDLPFRGIYQNCGFKSCFSYQECLEPMHTFLGRLKNPGEDTCGINQEGTSYYEAIKGRYENQPLQVADSPWQWVVTPLVSHSSNKSFCVDSDNTFSIIWPTDLSCP
jgi:hypothetical protein